MKTITYIMTVAVLLNSISICFSGEKKDDGAEMIVNSNIEFAFDLYRQLKAEEGNLFFSPYSISTALAMTYAGARGQTAEQMGQTLHFPECKGADSPGWMRTTTTRQNSSWCPVAV